MSEQPDWEKLVETFERWAQRVQFVAIHPSALQEEKEHSRYWLNEARAALTAAYEALKQEKDLTKQHWSSAENDVNSLAQKLDEAEKEKHKLQQENAALEALLHRYLILWDASGECDECEEQEMLCVDIHLPEQLAILEEVRKSLTTENAESRRKPD